MKKISLFRPYVSWLSIIYVLKVLLGTQLAEGPVVKTFEREFGQKFGKKNVVALNSGTSALELAYELAGIGPRDEVITPVLTCTATNLPLVHRGAKIVFADIDDETLNISIEDVEKKITPQTKAIVFVHFGGNGSGLRQLLVLAERHGITVIEDAAQVVGAPGSEWGLADFTCISLQAIKTLTAGDGGFLICKDSHAYAKARRLRWFGYDRDLKQKLGDTDLTEAGYKYHMNDISAAIGLGNLRSIGRILRKREQVRIWYSVYFGKQIYARHALMIRQDVLFYPWLTILMTRHARSLDAYLKVRGITSGPYHYRNDQYAIFAGDYENIYTRAGNLPNMDRLENIYTLLPFHHRMSKRDVRYVVDEVCSFIRYCEARRL